MKQQRKIIDYMDFILMAPFLISFLLTFLKVINNSFISDSSVKLFIYAFLAGYIWMIVNIFRKKELRILRIIAAVLLIWLVAAAAFGLMIIGSTW